MQQRTEQKEITLQEYQNAYQEILKEAPQTCQDQFWQISSQHLYVHSYYEYCISLTSEGKKLLNSIYIALRDNDLIDNCPSFKHLCEVAKPRDSQDFSGIKSLLPAGGIINNSYKMLHRDLLSQAPLGSKRDLQALRSTSRFFYYNEPLKIVTDSLPKNIVYAVGINYMVVQTKNKRFAFGENSYNKFGINCPSLIPLAVSVDLLKVSPMLLIASGGHNSFAFNNKNELYVCGDNRLGNLGVDEERQSVSQPVKIDLAKGENLKTIAAGNTYSLILTDQNNLWSCGRDLDNPEGGGQIKCWTKVKMPCEPGEKPINLASGSDFFCVLTDKNNIYMGVGGVQEYRCLGFNSICYDERIHTKAAWVKSTINSEFEPDETILSIAAGRLHMIVLTNKSLWISGRTQRGQLGIGRLAQSSWIKVEKIGLAPDEKMLEVAAGDDHSILRTNKGIWVCGNNRQGQLGLGNTKLSFYEWVKVENINLSPGERIIGLQVRANQSTFLTNKGIWACGENQYGQLGVGHTKPCLSFTPCPCSFAQEIPEKTEEDQAKNQSFTI